MRVLVTGGAGFIGSNLVHVLLSAGHETGVIDDLSSGTVANLHPAAWFRCLDVDGPGLTAAVLEFSPEAVVHLAAQVDVASSVADPEHDRRVNVDGTRAVASAAREAGARRLLFSSSAAVYGPDVPVPTPETAPKGPANPYGEHKLQAEGVVAREFGGRGRDFAVMRFSNVYGPRQRSEGEGGVVAIFADRMTAGTSPVIYGDGGQTRDFIHVGDVVSFMLSALEAPDLPAGEGADGPAFNVSTGAGISVDELVAAMRRVSGYHGSVEHAPERPGDIRHSSLDPAKARETLAWSAEVELATGLAQTVGWFERAHRG